jgi:hypothetical protein
MTGQYVDTWAIPILTSGKLLEKFVVPRGPDMGYHVALGYLFMDHCKSIWS